MKIITTLLIKFILSFAESPLLNKIQSSIQFNSRWTLQFINGISNDFQNLLKYYSGTFIFASFTELFVLLTTPFVFPTRAALYLALYLND